MTKLIFRLLHSISLCSAIGLAASLAFAGPTGVDFHATPEQLKQLHELLPKLPEKKVFFHWTKAETGLRWIAQGHMDKGETDFYNTPSGELQVYGPGLYMAESSTSSKNFGDFPIAIVIKAGTPLYDEQIVSEVFGRKLTVNENVELGREIPFIRNLHTRDWFLTNNFENLSQIEYAGSYGADATDFSALNDREFLASLEKIVKLHPAVEYLESFFHLMHYMDGISLVRAARVRPDNPWSQFEPEQFENFRRLNQSALSKTPTHPGQPAVWGSDFPNREVWSDELVKKTLPGFLNSIFGTHNAAFRGQSIGAGGANHGGTFLTSPQQLAVLLRNPYLQVDYQPDAASNGFAVRYSYPDIHHIQNYKDLLVPSVFDELTKYTETQIKSDQNLEVRLNQKLIEGLLQNLFWDLYGKPIDPADFLTRFISIHPFSDANGRSSRLLLQQALGDFGLSLPPMYLSDFDVLLSKETLTTVMGDTAAAYQKLERAMMSELLSSAFGRTRVPDYFHLPAFEELVTSMSIFGFRATDTIPSTFDDAIFHRQFSETFAKIKGPLWSMTPDSTLQTAMKLASDHGLTTYHESVLAKFSKQISDLKTGADFIDQSEVIRSYFAALSGVADAAPFRAAYLSKLKTLLEPLRFEQNEGDFAVLRAYLGVAPDEEGLNVLTKIEKRWARASLRDSRQIPSVVRTAREELTSEKHKLNARIALAGFETGRLSAATFASRLKTIPKGPIYEIADLFLADAEFNPILTPLNDQQLGLLFDRVNISRRQYDTIYFDRLGKLLEIMSHGTSPDMKSSRTTVLNELMEAVQHNPPATSKSQLAFALL